MTERSGVVATKKREFVPGVLVVKEKHGTAYFHAPDEETLHKVALLILTGRHKAGWYYAPEKPKAPDYTNEAEILKLRGEIQRSAAAKLRQYVGALAQFEYESERFKDIQKAIETKDGALAWKILRERSDYEYEQVTLEYYATKYAGGS